MPTEVGIAVVVRTEKEREETLRERNVIEPNAREREGATAIHGATGGIVAHHSAIKIAAVVVQCRRRVAIEEEREKRTQGAVAVRTTVGAAALFHHCLHAQKLADEGENRQWMEDIRGKLAMVATVIATVTFPNGTESIGKCCPER
ncbi:uncharacterized protein DS421_17g581740 [Arachis hypogaea]|nr:uncharacterized protein DS421_17g581740 [Arachis hypogaea]